MKLTDAACRAAKPALKQYKLTDGAGLYLLVKPTGGKCWQMRYSYLGKEKTYSIGLYPLVSLAEARDARTLAKKALQAGIDPTEAKREEKQKAIRKAGNTFKATALEWHETQKGRWTEQHAQNVLHRLERDVFPHIGNRPIDGIKAPDLLDLLRKIEKRGALDIAGRTRQICGQVFRYGIQIGRCENNPAESLRGALKPRKTTHYAAITPEGIPDLVRAVQRNDARLYNRTRNAILLSLLTFVRPGELRKALWSDIDLENKQWKIPAARMKSRRDHIIPLPRQAMRILMEQREETKGLNTDFVFPSQNNPKKPMSDGTVRIALQKLGYKGQMTAHGFRALARTGIREILDYPPDVIEVQLAHKPAGALGATYDRTQFISQRTTMMQEWADYIDTVCASGTVIHANFEEKVKSKNG